MIAVGGDSEALSLHVPTKVGKRLSLGIIASRCALDADRPLYLLRQ
jgi:hypothetical protein